MLEQELVGNPGDRRVRLGDRATRLEELDPREARVCRVEGPADVALAEIDDPGREIAHVDELRLTVGWCGREHLASACEAVWPVGEAPGRIVRPDDQAGTDDERALAERLTHSLLAERLQRAIALVRDLVGGVLAKLRDRALFVDGDAEVGIHGDRGHEAVASRSRERFGRPANDAGEVPGRVDDGVPLATRQEPEISGAIAAQLLDLGIQLRIRLPAVEERELVAGRESRVCDRAPEKSRPAEQEQLHASSARPVRSRSTSSSVL